jgi:hypothetical protein
VVVLIAGENSPYYQVSGADLPLDQNSRLRTKVQHSGNDMRLLQADCTKDSRHESRNPHARHRPELV